ncbi:MAG TPA: arylamine N-acetyltransferase [Mycobacterium sp.]|nr:arylamine N-acetyltransferase [Mycobacterium sp.]
MHSIALTADDTVIARRWNGYKQTSVPAQREGPLLARETQSVLASAAAAPAGGGPTKHRRPPCKSYHRSSAVQDRIETRPRVLTDFDPTCWWQQTWPGSHFRAGPVCSRLTDSGGMITLADHVLISTEAGERIETTLASDEDVLAAYRERFGMNLERVPVPVEDH